MSPEVLALTWTAVLTSTMWMPYLVARTLTLGTWGVLAFPPRVTAGGTKAPPWADRAARAHANATENLVVFAALILAVELTGGGDSMTALAASVYLGSRVAHWLLYLAGVPVLRTLSFLAGWVCQLLLASHVLL